MTRLEILDRLASISQMDEATRLLDELSLLEQTPVVKEAISFVIHNVMRKLSGLSPRRVSRTTMLTLFRPLEHYPQDVDWNVWMQFFGVDVGYCREDANKERVLQEHLPKAAEAAKDRKAGVHFVPFVLGSDIQPGYSSRRSKNNVLACPTFFADLDYDKAEGWQTIQKLEVLPSIIVETSRGWHVYWPLIAPINVSAWEKVQSTVTDTLNGDRSCNTPAHSMRMPSSWHCKREPFYVQIAWADWHKFSLEEMELAFPPKKTEERIKPLLYPQSDGIRMPKTNYLPTGASHNTLVSESGRVYAGISEDNAQAARQMVVSWYMSFKQNKKHSDEREVQRRCDELEKKQFGRIVSR